MISSLRQHAIGNEATPGSAAAPLTGPRLLQVHLGTQVFTMQHNAAYVIGSAPTSNIELKDPLLAPQAATVTNDQLSVHAPGLLLNGRELIAGSDYNLRDGDVLKLGKTEMSISQLSPRASHAQATGHLPVAHEQRNQAIAGGTGALAHNSIQDKEADAMRHQVAAKPMYGGVYGQKFSDDELDSFSPPQQQQQHVEPVQHTQLIQPGQAAVLNSGTVIAAGSNPIMAKETTVASTAPIAVVSKHHSPAKLYEQKMGTHEIQGSERAQQPIAIIPAQQPQQHQQPLTHQSVFAPAATTVPQGVSTASATTQTRATPSSSPLNLPITETQGSKFSTRELAQIMRDMIDVSGLKMTDGADTALPSMIVLLPLRLRMELSSSHLKQWLRHAETERQARISNQTVSSSEGPTDVKHEFANPRDSISESDMAYGLLRLIEPEIDAHTRASPAFLASSSGNGTGQNHFGDEELTNLWVDMSDLSGDHLAPAAKQRLPVMLQHLPSSYRAGFDSSHIKSWIRSTHERREERQMAARAIQGAGVTEQTQTLPQGGSSTIQPVNSAISHQHINTHGSHQPHQQNSLLSNAIQNISAKGGLVPTARLSAHQNALSTNDQSQQQDKNLSELDLVYSLVGLPWWHAKA